MRQLEPQTSMRQRHDMKTLGRISTDVHNTLETFHAYVAQKKWPEKPRKIHGKGKNWLEKQ